jgi:ribosomal-protein-alanine N-acetyltransferase
VSLVRPATLADYPAFARLFPELRVPDPCPTEALFEARMLPSTVILEGAPGEEAAGYAFWQRYGATAHVVHVVVGSHARRRGAGRALMADLRGRALAARCTRWYLNVKQDNAAAIALYEACGMAIESEAWAMTTAWSVLARLEGGAHEASAHALTAEDDAAIAARLGLDAGRLPVLRQRAGVMLQGLRERGDWVGFAAFDPGFPGVYPLRVTRPALMRPLLEALRPHATQDRVLLMVEGEPALRDALVTNGAELLFAFFSMGAAL